MSSELFLHIADAMEARDSYSKNKTNAAGELGQSALQKIATTMRMITSSVPVDSVDEIKWVGESTSILKLRRMLKALIQIFDKEYLRSPNTDYTARLMAIGASRGFPGVLGCLDYMHWRWKNCPTA